MNLSSDISRRIFVNRIAKGLVGCSVGGSFANANENSLEIVGKPTADSVICLFMDGGMSHLDTFDLRPGNREIQGRLTGMRTKVPGIHVTDKLPGLAAQMDRIAQIRSMSHCHGGHPQAKRHVRSDYSAFHEDAVRRMDNGNPENSDVSKEPRRVREAYGKSEFGQGCLLARRLVERGSRFVGVELGGWDTHTDNHRRVAGNCAVLDQGLSALLKDLTSRGMLERTLVVLTTEFGRSPTINEFGGRNHNPSGFTSLLMGGGVIGGAVYGKTEAGGRGIAENPVSVRDFNSTIAYALGGRAVSVAGGDTGEPVTAIFG